MKNNMKIIAHGNNYKQFVCNNCGCIFESGYHPHCSVKGCTTTSGERIPDGWYCWLNCPDCKKGQFYKVGDFA